MENDAFSLGELARGEIRRLLEPLLERAFRTLEAERVLPRSEYRPWIHVGRDYFGHVLGGRDDLAEALQRELPNRFTSKIDSPDWPWLYSRAVLEAAVAAATRDSEPYTTSSPSVQQTVDRFFQTLEDSPTTVVAQVISDVELTNSSGWDDEPPLGTRVGIRGVEIIHTGIGPEDFIEREVPSAGFDVERENVLGRLGTQSLLVAKVASTDAPDIRSRQARSAIRDLVTSIRLVTASTGELLLDIEGDPHFVHGMTPRITPFRGFDLSLGNRPVFIGPRDIHGLEQVYDLVSELRKSSHPGPLTIALGRLNRSLDQPSATFGDLVVDLAVGIEAALAGESSTEIGLRLRNRAAELLETEGDSASGIYADVKTLYDLRSTLLHGGAWNERRVRRMISSVTTASVTDAPGEQALLAVDRWRDLLRRAILVRISLRTAATPWPTEASRGVLDVDLALRTEVTRADWRAHHRDYWSRMELFGALEPATPLNRISAGTTLLTRRTRLPS